MSDRAIGFAMAHRPTLWNRLGFGACAAHVPDHVDEAPEWAPGALSTETRIVLDWRDRLRVLLSGRMMVSLKTKTDVPVRRALSVSSVSVLPPSFAGRP
jgi:hypothetical protein